MADNKLTNIQVYRKKWNINIGIIIFGVVFIYLIVTVLMYLTSNHVSAYEVREGSILKDNAYTGIIFRDEMVVQADTGGYVNYFALEGSKVGAKTRVYSISDKKLEFEDSTTEESQELSSEEQAALSIKTQSFTESFKDQQFNDVYTLKNTIMTMLESKSNQGRQAQLDAMSAQEAGGLKIYSAASDGIIIYATDGYETMTVDDVTEDMIAKKDYKKISLGDNTKIKAGDPVYKLIRANSWSIAILLDDETAAQLKDTTSVKVRFSKDNETAQADFSIKNRKDAKIGILSFDSSMIRYAEERYLDLELILENQSGLKIPKSSVVNKEFYLIPEDYLTQGGNSKEDGILVDTGKDNPEFQSATLFDRDEETGKVYLDANAFEKGTILVKPDSSDTCRLNKTERVAGVYNINKGYAVFKQVNILCESDEYYIVESGDTYGLSNYDYIALYGEDVHENDVVF